MPLEILLDVPTRRSDSSPLHQHISERTLGEQRRKTGATKLSLDHGVIKVNSGFAKQRVVRFANHSVSPCIIVAYQREALAFGFVNDAKSGSLCRR